MTTNRCDDVIQPSYFVKYFSDSKIQQTAHPANDLGNFDCPNIFLFRDWSLRIPKSFQTNLANEDLFSLKFYNLDPVCSSFN